MPKYAVTPKLSPEKFGSVSSFCRAKRGGISKLRNSKISRFARNESENNQKIGMNKESFNEKI